MTAREYLSRVQRMRTRVHRIEEHMEECYLVLLNIKAVESLFSRSSRPWLDEMKNILSEQADEIRECRAYITAAERSVQALPKATHREVMTLRYVGEKPMGFDEIAEIMNRSESRVRHIHLNALKAFENTACMVMSGTEDGSKYI